jgi:hypothetical protein
MRRDPAGERRQVEEDMSPWQAAVLSHKLGKELRRQAPIHP